MLFLLTGHILARIVLITFIDTFDKLTLSEIAYKKYLLNFKFSITHHNVWLELIVSNLKKKRCLVLNHARQVVR